MTRCESTAAWHIRIEVYYRGLIFSPTPDDSGCFRLEVVCSPTPNSLAMGTRNILLKCTLYRIYRQIDGTQHGVPFIAASYNICMPVGWH
eukprot:scaffold155840_cov39-Prasinocladus_malaysianus.AAC.2